MCHCVMAVKGKHEHACVHAWCALPCAQPRVLINSSLWEGNHATGDTPISTPSHACSMCSRVSCMHARCACPARSYVINSSLWEDDVSGETPIFSVELLHKAWAATLLAAQPPPSLLEPKVCVGVCGCGCGGGKGVTEGGG